MPSRGSHSFANAAGLPRAAAPRRIGTALCARSHSACAIPRFFCQPAGAIGSPLNSTPFSPTKSRTSLRRDALAERLSLFHRAIFWFSPLSWWLARHLADLAEEASDDAALAAGADRTRYAETLLGFFAALEAAPGRVWWQGVSMATAGQAEKRVDRILEWKGSVAMRLKKPVVIAYILCRNSSRLPHRSIPSDDHHHPFRRRAASRATDDAAARCSRCSPPPSPRRGSRSACNAWRRLARPQRSAAPCRRSAPGTRRRCSQIPRTTPSEAPASFSPPCASRPVVSVVSVERCRILHTSVRPLALPEVKANGLRCADRCILCRTDGNRRARFVTCAPFQITRPATDARQRRRAIHHRLRQFHSQRLVR